MFRELYNLQNDCVTLPQNPIKNMHYCAHFQMRNLRVREVK